MEQPSSAWFLMASLILVSAVVTYVTRVVCYWRILVRTGRRGHVSLLLLLPVVHLGVMVWTAFGRWPIEDGDA